MTQIVRFYSKEFQLDREADAELCAQLDAWYDTLPFPNVLSMQVIDHAARKTLIVVYRRSSSQEPT